MATNPLPPKGAAPPPLTDRLRSFAKYSGIAFQMLATIGLSAWAGISLDRHFQTKNPWWTIGFMLSGVLLALYQVIRGLARGD
jgi:ATP synthase protein I